MTEETHANLYRREMDVELQYKENKDSLYVNNVLKTSINWNESFANTILNGTNTRQAVEPRKRHLRDEFSVIKKFRNNKSMDVNASFDYLYLLTSSSCHPKVFVKEFCYFLMSCHQHCLGVNLLVQR